MVFGHQANAVYNEQFSGLIRALGGILREPSLVRDTCRSLDDGLLEQAFRKYGELLLGERGVKTRWGRPRREQTVLAVTRS
jgi:hypothetical protein